jgi:hypothetical protein
MLRKAVVAMICDDGFSGLKCSEDRINKDVELKVLTRGVSLYIG